MNSEMNTTDANSFRAIKNGPVILDSSSVQVMRYRLHELANVFTGVMIAGGLLSQYLEASPLEHYATDILEDSERGCALVREFRSQLLAACGEAELGRNASDSIQGQ
jgi:hypothetical protein